MRRTQPAYEISGNTIIVELTKGQVAYLDLEDLAIAQSRCWSAVLDKKSGFFYATARRQVSDPPSSSFHIPLHRLVMGDPIGQLVDHIDGDSLNCRRGNLRACTNAQNLQNRRGATRVNSTGIRGVTIKRVEGRIYYRAIVAVAGRQVERSFPYNTDGLVAATIAVQQMRSSMMTHSIN